MDKKLGVLGLGLDYLWLKEKQTRGNFIGRIESISSRVGHLTRIVFTPKEYEPKSTVVNSNVEIIYTGSRNKLTFIIDAVSITRTILNKRKIDLISAEDPFIASIVGLILKIIFKIPLNIQVNHDRINNPLWLKETRKNYILNLIANFALKKADSLRVVSERVKTNLSRIGINEEKIFVIPSLIMQEKLFSPVDRNLREKYTNRGFTKIVIFVGRLSIEKDIPTLLKAFKKVIAIHSNALLLIIGGGSEESHLKSLAAKLNIIKNLDFVGPVDHSEIGKFYAAADIFALSSLHEGSGDVLVEAALFKKPIITTDVGDARNLVKDGESGFIVKIGDYNGIADKIIYLLDVPNRIDEFGQRSYLLATERLEKYNDIDLLIGCWNKTIKLSKSINSRPK